MSARGNSITVASTGDHFKLKPAPNTPFCIFTSGGYHTHVAARLEKYSKALDTSPLFAETLRALQK
jgi:hypothetical protein